MILILVMLANSFSGCTLGAIAFGADNLDDLKEAIAIDIAVGILILLVVIFAVKGNAEVPVETGIYLANAEHNPLMYYYPVIDIINSLPEMERVSLMEKLNSLPEEKLAFLVSTVASLPQAEIAASIERLKALSETELVSAVQDFNALSEAEFDLLSDKLNERANSLPATDYVAVADVAQERVTAWQPTFFAVNNAENMPKSGQLWLVPEPPECLFKRRY